jgi:hypothetical protein
MAGEATILGYGGEGRERSRKTWGMWRWLLTHHLLHTVYKLMICPDHDSYYDNSLLSALAMK